MRRLKDRLLTAAVAAGLAAALGPATPAGAADDGPALPTPSPSALPSVGVAPRPAVGPTQGSAADPTPSLTPGATPGSSPSSTPGPTIIAPEAPGASATSAVPGGQGAPDPAGIGGLTDRLVASFLDRIWLTAALVVTSGPSASQTGAALLQPGGGSSTDAREWQPKADLQVPKAVAVPPRTKRSAALTKEQLIWAAYASAAKATATRCHLPVMLLAAIGEVESSSLRGRSLSAAHDAVPPVRGPVLSGGAYPAIRDTDGGRLDGDPVWDRAVGPMQFIPGTWRIWGADGNGDGVEDPQNIEDAALAAARYLCAGGRDLSRPGDLRAAVFSYNHSGRYVATVLGLVDAVMSGADAGP